MKHDIETVREAIKIYPMRSEKEHPRGFVYDLPDPIQVATVAAILSPTDDPDDDTIKAAIKLIADTKRVLGEIRSDAEQPEVDFGATVSVQEAAEETGLTVRTIQSYASQKHESGKPFFDIENGRINRLSLATIRKLKAEKKTTRAKAGFIKSKFKRKKRKANK
jgi:hypothetical protein